MNLHCLNIGPLLSHPPPGYPQSLAQSFDILFGFVTRHDFLGLHLLPLGLFKIYIFRLPWCYNTIDGLTKDRNAALLVAVFAVIGAIFQGQHVMQTISKGIVKTDLNYLAVCVALICSGFFVTLATFFRIPTSTSQAIVGGVIGIGLAVGAEINFTKVIHIAESWIICPILVMAISFAAGSVSSRMPLQTT